MKLLYLIRHSIPQIQPGHPASQWSLSDEGRRRASAFSETLAAKKLARMITSREPKARETAVIIAARLGIPCSVAEGLHEQRRENVSLLSQEDFHLQIQTLFEHPQQVVFGEESALAAQRRMVAAVKAVIRQYPRQTVAIVTHGTVMSLFAAHWNAVDGYAIWQGLEMPAVFAFALPGYRLIEPQI